ncbi:MAG: hypothetical protein JXA00_05735 [Candidatus Thermoplasmatota archaeon]|nr:hypothetical protein [Candidatus Thermoplasmatota archaeon]
MTIRRRLFIIGMLVLVTAMVMATQYAVTRLGYDYNIVHPSDGNLRFIGSDNASDNIRLLRISGTNGTTAALRLAFGNFSTNQSFTYSAAFGIVNEEQFPVNITHINVMSSNWTYMKIWLHGDRDADAHLNTTDPSTVYMFNNGTVVNVSNTTAWILAPGNNNASDMCSNVSDRANNSCNTTWDETAHVRFSRNNTNAVSNLSDYVWVQIEIEIEQVIDYSGQHTGIIYLYFEAETLP